MGEDFVEAERSIPASVGPNEPIPSPHSNGRIGLSVANSRHGALPRPEAFTSLLFDAHRIRAFLRRDLGYGATAEFDFNGETIC
jgi:hypothetical protein